MAAQAKCTGNIRASSSSGFPSFAERNEKAHGDLRAEIHEAENRMIKWVIGTGIAVVIAWVRLTVSSERWSAFLR